MWIRKEHLFTISSVLVLLLQYFIFNQNISILKKENEKLVNQIKIGHRRHIEIVKEKTLEKNAIIASYEYTINKENENKDNTEPEEIVKINKDFKNGYTEGFQKAIENSN